MHFFLSQAATRCCSVEYNVCLADAFSPACMWPSTLSLVRPVAPTIQYSHAAELARTHPVVATWSTSIGAAGIVVRFPLLVVKPMPASASLME